MCYLTSMRNCADKITLQTLLDARKSLTETLANISEPRIRSVNAYCALLTVIENIEECFDDLLEHSDCEGFDSFRVAE